MNEWKEIIDREDGYWPPGVAFGIYKELGG